MFYKLLSNSKLLWVPFHLLVSYVCTEHRSRPNTVRFVHGAVVGTSHGACGRQESGGWQRRRQGEEGQESSLGWKASTGGVGGGTCLQKGQSIWDGMPWASHGDRWAMMDETASFSFSAQPGGPGSWTMNKQLFSSEFLITSRTQGQCFCLAVISLYCLYFWLALARGSPAPLLGTSKALFAVNYAVNFLRGSKWKEFLIIWSQDTISSTWFLNPPDLFLWQGRGKTLW